MAKILIFDLECSLSFKGDIGHLIAGSYQWFGSNKIVDLVSLTPMDDQKLAEGLLAQLIEADMIVTWNGTMFDLKYLQTRLWEFDRKKVIPDVAHWDGLKVARKKLALHSNRLDAVAEFLGIKFKKTPLDIMCWRKAGVGDEASIRKVSFHCHRDVQLTTEVYKRLRPLSIHHPNVAVIEGVPQGCPVCGKDRLHKRGTLRALRHYRIRFQCQNCSKWSTSHPINYKKV